MTSIPHPQLSTHLCECGCGQFTLISQNTNRRHGSRKGHPLRFVNGHNRRRPLTERFWSKVDQAGGPDACWPWQGSTHKGYGQIELNQRPLIASRLSWELTNGPIPDGMYVCHACDNPPCCNPAHLFLGEPMVNTVDKVQKGRASGGCLPGEQNPNAKLTAEQVLTIRQRYTAGEKASALAREYGLGLSTMCRIVKGQAWTHL